MHAWKLHEQHACMCVWVCLPSCNLADLYLFTRASQSGMQAGWIQHGVLFHSKVVIVNLVSNPGPVLSLSLATGSPLSQSTCTPSAGSCQIYRAHGMRPCRRRCWACTRQRYRCCTLRTFSSARATSRPCHQHIFLSSSTVPQCTVSIRGSPCWLPWLHGSFTSRACRSRKGTCCRACRLSCMYTHMLSVFQWCWNAHAGPFEHTLFDTSHMNTRRKTRIESLFLVTMNHAGRPVRTHARIRIHQTHSCNYEMYRQAFWKTHTVIVVLITLQNQSVPSQMTNTHTTLFFRNAATHTDTHASHIFQDNQVLLYTWAVVHAHAYIPVLLQFQKYTGRPVRTHALIALIAHTHTHTHTHLLQCWNAQADQFEHTHTQRTHCTLIPLSRCCNPLGRPVWTRWNQVHKGPLQCILYVYVHIYTKYVLDLLF